MITRMEALTMLMDRGWFPFSDDLHESCLRPTSVMREAGRPCIKSSDINTEVLLEITGFRGGEKLVEETEFTTRAWRYVELSPEEFDELTVASVDERDIFSDVDQ